MALNTCYTQTLACPQNAKYFTNYDLLVGICSFHIATQFNLKIE